MQNAELKNIRLDGGSVITASILTVTFQNFMDSNYGNNLLTNSTGETYDYWKEPREALIDFLNRSLGLTDEVTGSTTFKLSDGSIITYQRGNDLTVQNLADNYQGGRDPGYGNSENINTTFKWDNGLVEVKQ